MEIKALKLGFVTKDKATGLKGTLTHWGIGQDKAIKYLLQPKGLDDKGQPVSKLALEKERLEFTEGDFEIVDVPFEILGTKVTNDPSGFKGTAVRFMRHINGCFHVVIQPEGRLKNNEPIEFNDFDLRECSGKMIPKLSEKELKDSKQETPSPTKDKFIDDMVIKSHSKIL